MSGIQKPGEPPDEVFKPPALEQPDLEVPEEPKALPRRCENCLHFSVAKGVNPVTDKLPQVCRLKAPLSLVTPVPFQVSKGAPMQMRYETFTYWPSVRKTDYCAEGFTPNE